MKRENELSPLSPAQALALLAQADAAIEEAQEVFAPLEGPVQGADLEPSSFSSLRAAALKLQTARRLLEESSGILEACTDATDATDATDITDIATPVSGVTAACPASCPAGLVDASHLPEEQRDAGS